MSNWFISVNGDQKGPYPTDQLRQLVADGVVPRDAYVWKDGMAQWALLSQVGLGDEPRVAPTPAYQPREQSYRQPSSERRDAVSARGVDHSVSSDSAAAKDSGWFSFQGRIGRRTLWLKYLLTFTILEMIVGAILALTVKIDPTHIEPQQLYIIGAVSIVFFLILFIPSLGASIKRLHDHDRSGWFLLLALVPLANVWLVVEIYFVRGTIGPNRFGPDPVR